MLSQVVGPFVNQVNKFNPGIVDRMNIAFDNVSAAAGRMFEPIIVAQAIEFADELKPSSIRTSPGRVRFR